MFVALSDVYNNCKISFLPQPWWPAVMQVPYILTISPPSLNNANLPTALQVGQKGKINIFKSFLCSNKWQFFSILSVYFVVI